MGMQRFDFLKNKYGKELLVDLGRIETLKGFVLSDALHFITFYEVLVITKGRGVYRLDGEEAPYERGAVIVTLPEQVRQWKVEEAAQGFSFFFEGEFLNTYFRDDVFLNRFAIFDYNRPSIVTYLQKADLEKCLWAIHEVEREFSTLKGDSSHIFRSLLYYSISLIDRLYREQHQLTKLDTNPVILRFQRLLNRYIRIWRTVADYASALHVSHNHLNALCKKHLSQTALQVIHRRLLLEAKREVRYSNKTVSEIAHALHFSDVSNFNRFFRKMTGRSPRQYRQADQP